MPTFTGTAGDDRLFGTAGTDSLVGLAGNDQLYDQSGGADTLVGGPGDDLLSTFTSSGNDWLDGGPGRDSLYGGLGDDQIDGGDDADLVQGSAGNDTIEGGSGNDTLNGQTGNDSLSGGTGDDVLYDQQNGADTLRGGVGNDRLSTFGSTDGDWLDGGEGNDTLYGGSGNDTLASGAGEDLLRGEGGDDTYFVDSRRAFILDSGGNDTAIVSVSFTKIPASIENVSYVGGALPLPYWVSALLPDEAAGLEYLRLMPEGPAVFRYCFPTSLPSYDDLPAHAAGWQPFTATQIERTREALAYVSSICGLRFVETADPAQPHTLTFANNLQSGSSGYATYPSNNSFRGGDLFLNSAYADNFTLRDGQFSAYTLMHELGHALGLEHPFDEPDAAGLLADAPHLQGSEDAGLWTLMAYQRNSAQYALRYSPLDIAALQYLYGPSPTSRTGDDVYVPTWSEPSFIWDGGGNDTLDARGAPRAVDLSLVSGVWGFMGPARAANITAAGQITVNFGSVIENLLGSRHDDRLAGNDAANRIEGGSGADAIDGGAGNDILMGGAGNDTLAGGAGIDTATFGFARDQYSIRVQAGEVSAASVASATDGTDLISGIERLRFADRSVALDLDGNAGVAAKVLAVVWGRAAVANPAFAGVALQIVDAYGFGLEQLAQVALAARLGSAYSHTQVADLVYANLIGQPADGATRAAIVDLLDRGVFSRSSLVAAVADLELNRLNIDYAGLVRNGLDYLPLA